MKQKIALTCLSMIAALAWNDVAQAQEAPAPHRMPRVPVTVQDSHDVAPPSHQVQGSAVIIDGEKLRVADTDLRLFGIVPPQLAASFGPQARSALDTLVGTQSVTCQIRDRDRDGRLLATCQTTGGSDLALDLLKHGLAVTARGSLVGTDLAAPYLAAEQAAQNQKIGLWSINVPPSAPAVAVVPTPPAHQEATVAPAPAPAKEEKVAPRTDKAAEAQQTATQAKITADIIDQHAQTHSDNDSWAQEDQTGFFERYQILIAGFLMMGTAISIIGALWIQKRRDKSDETKATAAALRGELMAARGVCLGRIKSITTDTDDKTATWPRIRATLYGAYVGRLGLLGAELARQVASIYGQASDYAALYSGAAQDTPKKNALETLVKHIDEVLPKLAIIEQGGSYVPSPAYIATPVVTPRPQPRSHYDAPAARPATPKVVVPTPENQKSEATASITAEEQYVPVTPQFYAAPARQSVALWESVRGFIQGHRNAIAQPHAEQHPLDPEVHEYTAIIEADMARYPYGDSVEPLDISPNKPPKARSGV